MMKTIVWDIDDVLNDLTRTWFKLVWSKENPGTSMKYEQLSENPPDKLLGIERREYLASLDEFRLSPEADAMQPDTEVLKWFDTWGDKYRHLALTARPIRTVSPAVAWLMRNYGEWFQTVSFVPSSRPDENPRQPDRSKSDFLAWLGKADYFIDDHAQNVAGTTGLGIRAFLVAQPWNDSSLGLNEILKIINDENKLGQDHP